MSVVARAPSKPAPVNSPSPPPIVKKAAVSRATANTAKPPASNGAPSPAPAAPTPAPAASKPEAQNLPASGGQAVPADANHNGGTPTVPIKRRGRPAADHHSPASAQSAAPTGKKKEFRSPNDTLTDDESGEAAAENNNILGGTGGDSEDEGIFLVAPLPHDPPILTSSFREWRARESVRLLSQQANKKVPRYGSESSGRCCRSEHDR
jgi:hypothetical protein